MKSLIFRLTAAALLFSAFAITTHAQTPPTPDVIQFAADTFEVWETDSIEAGSWAADSYAAVFFDFQDGNNFTGPTFLLSVTGGTATQGTDFRIQEPGIRPFYTTKGVSLGWGSSLYGLDDGIHEPDETIELTLTNPGTNTMLGPRTKTVVTIRNGPPTFLFQGGAVEERFGGSVAEVIVERRGDREPAVSVDIRVDEADPPSRPDQVSATRGVDFIAVNQRLHFASEETNKVVEVQILDDGEPEWNEFFRVTLSEPSPGAVIQEGSADWFIYDNEVPALYDVTQAGDGFESKPFVLLTAGNSPGDGIAFNPVFVPLPQGGHLVSGEFRHINGVERPRFGRLFPDGELDESFVPPADLMVEGGPLPSRAQVLALRSEQILLGLESGLRRLNRDGREDQTFRPPVEPRGLRPIGELPDGSVYVTGGTNQILRLDLTGTILETVVIGELEGAGFTGGLSAMWLPDPAPGRFLINASFRTSDSTLAHETRSFLPDGTLEENFLEFEGRPDLWLADHRILVSGGDTSFTIRDSSGRLDSSWLPPRLGVCHQAPGVLFGIRLAERGDRLWVENRFCSLNDLFLPDSIRELAFHLTAARSPRTALQVGLTQTTFPANVEPFFTLGFRRLGRSDAPATAQFSARVVTALSRQVTIHTGTISFAPLEVLKTYAIPIQDVAGPDYPLFLEVTITAAEGFEALPTPYTWGELSVPLEHIKRLRDGRVLLGGTGPTDTTRLEFSTDLQSWHPLTDLLGGFNGESTLWLDASATNAATRYYRAVTP